MIKKRIAAQLLVLVFLFTCLCPTCFAASVRQEDVELQLQDLMAKYCGTYWYGSYGGATTCKGFADMISNELFGNQGAGYYSDNRYTLPIAASHGYTCLGVLSPDEISTDSVQLLLSQALPGDYVQCVRYTGTQHSMIVVWADAQGITFFDSNMKGSRLCASYHYTWEQAASYLSRGISLYHYKDYIASTVTPCSANGHKWRETTVEPTCEGEGYILGVCTVCGVVRHGDSIPPLGHDFQISETVPCTNTVDGYVRRTCTRCGQTKDEPIICPFHRFTDISETQWYYAYVRTLVSQGLMNGLNETTFAPNATLTRAMLVTILYRMDGSPESGVPGYKDIKAGDWYANAVGWAAAYGIVTGYTDGTFRPNDSVTREQAAAILARFATHSGCDVTTGKDISAFSDAYTVSPYARSAMAWAVEKNILSGFPDNTLRPKGSATRAQIAKMLVTFRDVCGDAGVN